MNIEFICPSRSERIQNPHRSVQYGTSSRGSEVKFTIEFVRLLIELYYVEEEEILPIFKPQGAWAATAINNIGDLGRLRWELLLTSNRKQ